MDSINGIMGLAIGDAMGVPLEFSIREKLLENKVINMIGHGSHDVPKGSWSDDTSMTLATIDSINNLGAINVNDIADNFLLWFKNAKYTPQNKVFDIGKTTLMALAIYEDKKCCANKCGGWTESDNGNGSLMRMLPIAYFCYKANKNEKEIFDIVKDVSSITHRHEISILGCYIYVMFAICLLKSMTKYDAYEYIKKLDYSMFDDKSLGKYNRILKEDISKFSIDNIYSTGYVVYTLEATLWVVLTTDNYDNSIIKAINLGNDTDTIGACVGGLTGIIYKLQSINKEWKNDLIQYDYIKSMCEKFDYVLDNI